MKVKLETNDKIYDIKVSSDFVNGGDSLIFEFINPLCNDRIMPVSISQLEEDDKLKILSNEKIVQRIKQRFSENLNTNTKSKSKIKSAQKAFETFYNGLSDELKLLYELN